MTKINISNLDEGIHNFEFVVSPDDIELGSLEAGDNISVNVDLYKVGNQLSLKINTKVRLIFQCDRCIDKFDYDLNNSFDVIYKFDFSGANQDNDDDDIKFITPNTKFIDIKDDLRDYILLSVPMKKAPAETDGVCTYCGKDISSILKVNRKSEINPVWEKLIKTKIK